MAVAKQGIFKRVHNSEKKKIFKDLKLNKTLVVVKSPDDNVFMMRVENMMEDKILTCSAPDVSKCPDQDQDVIVNFSVGYEKYFFQTKLTATPPIVLLDITTDLFILQRRKQARMTLPDSYQAGYNIIVHKNQPVFYELKVLDFSSGGCRLAFPTKTPYFYTNDVVEGVLRLGKRRPIELGGLVRHTFTTPDDNKLPQVFGLQFYPLDKTMESKLLTIFMDIQREISLTTE